MRPDIASKRIIVTQRGAASSRGIQTILNKMAKSVRIQKLPPHMARHTFAKNIIYAGVTLEKVAMLLGHTSFDTTMIYTTPDMSDLNQAVNSLDV